jgi:hypothetical protein
MEMSLSCHFCHSPLGNVQKEQNVKMGLYFLLHTFAQKGQGLLNKTALEDMADDLFQLLP